MSKVQYISCPFCKSTVEIDISWAIRNGRVFCGSCCKSFDIRVGEETDDDPPKREESVKEATIEEKFDEGVKEILDEDDDNDYSWF